jgi:hypothetical protein
MYRSFGFELVSVGPGVVHDRVSRIKAELSSSDETSVRNPEI